MEFLHQNTAMCIHFLEFLFLLKNYAAYLKYYWLDSERRIQSDRMSFSEVKIEFSII